MSFGAASCLQPNCSGGLDSRAHKVHTLRNLIRHQTMLKILFRIFDGRILKISNWPALNFQQQVIFLRFKNIFLRKVPKLHTM